MAELRYLDRASGTWQAERVFGERELNLLYGPLRAWTERVFSRRGFSRLYGAWQRSPLSRRQIPEFVARLGIDASEAARPLDRYPTLDAFFTRRLRPGARPLDRHPDHLVAPAEGRTLVLPELGPQLQVKQSAVSVEELVGGGGARYLGGAAVVVRLAPADYHRIHAPAEGELGPTRWLGSRLHSVHPIALEAGARSFANHRAVLELDSGRFGRLCLIAVGALVVGTVALECQPGPVARGQDLGTFRFGGSTVVLLSEPGRVVLDPDLVQTSAAGHETLVRVGTRLGRGT